MLDEKKFIDLCHRQKESGLTVKEFCSNEIIAPSTFYYWQKKLRVQNRLRGFIPVVVNPSPVLSRHATSSGTQQANSTSHVEIEYPNKVVLRIKSGLDISVIKALIHLTD